MTEFKKYSFEDGCETFCAFDYDECRNFAEIIGAENLHGEWYYFALGTFCDCNRLDDIKYMEWLLYDENECNGFSCGSFDSLEELIESGEANYFDASLLRYFLENK